MQFELDKIFYKILEFRDVWHILVTLKMFRVNNWFHLDLGLINLDEFNDTLFYNY